MALRCFQEKLSAFVPYFWKLQLLILDQLITNMTVKQYTVNYQKNKSAVLLQGKQQRVCGNNRNVWNLFDKTIFYLQNHMQPKSGLRATRLLLYQFLSHGIYLERSKEQTKLFTDHWQNCCQILPKPTPKCIGRCS